MEDREDEANKAMAQERTHQEPGQVSESVAEDTNLTVKPTPLSEICPTVEPPTWCDQRHVAAAWVLSSGGTQQEAADVASVHVNTVRKWLKHPEKGAEFQWIIDPLDGTTNYAHNFPVFTVSVALAKNKEIVIGVVFDPMRNEMFSAIKGEGVYLNGKKIRVSSVDDLDKSLVATGFPYDIRVSKENNIIHFNNFVTRVQGIRRCGSAAMDLCYVACGRFDGFWELKLKPWDMAAGALIVHEAGGRISDFQDGEFSLFDAEILASNGLIHSQMVNVLQLGKK